MARGGQVKQHRAGVPILGSSSRVLGMAACGALAWSSLFACATAEVKPKVAAKPPASVPQQEREPEGVLPPVAPDSFERGDQFEVKFEATLFKSPPVSLSREDLKSLMIALTESNKTTTWLSVDDHAPRQANGQKFSIASLLNEDVELGPGPHFLIATRVEPGREMNIHTHAFFLEVEPSGLPPSPGCILHAPLLTLNGPKAARAPEFWSVPLEAGIDRVTYEATGPGYASRGEAPPATVMHLKEPPSGDVRLSVRCFSGAEEKGADTQVITINADAPDPEEVD